MRKNKLLHSIVLLDKNDGNFISIAKKKRKINNDDFLPFSFISCYVDIQTKACYTTDKSVSSPKVLYREGFYETSLPSYIDADVAKEINSNNIDEAYFQILENVKSKKRKWLSHFFFC